VIAGRPLRAGLVVGCVALVLTLVAGCGNPGVEPLEALIAHTESLVGLALDGDGDGDAIAAWDAARHAEIARLRLEVQALERELQPAQRRALRARWEAAADRMLERLEGRSSAPPGDTP